MTKYPTSGDLAYSMRKGLHYTEGTWWIDLGIEGYAFRLMDLDRVLVAMDNLGRLTVNRGYLWDGSSGPTRDGPADPVPSLVHDAIYEAMRCRALPFSIRKKSDAVYRDLLLERGMAGARSWGRYIGLRLVGGASAAPIRGPQYPKRLAK